VLFCVLAAIALFVLCALAFFHRSNNERKIEKNTLDFAGFLFLFFRLDFFRNWKCSGTGTALTIRVLTNHKPAGISTLSTLIYFFISL
jgi:hypothetical protein